MPPKKSAKPLAGCTFCISGSMSVSKAEMNKRLTGAGADIASSVTKAVTHLLSTDGDVAKGTGKVAKAIGMGLPVVSEDFVDDSISSGKKASEANYLLAGEAPAGAAKGKKGGKRKKEEEEEEEEKPAPVKKGSKKQPAKKQKAAASASVLDGKKICFTGTLTMKRADAKKQAEAAGATVSGSVTKTTDILVAGPGAGAKIADAESKGVEVWTEDQFTDALGGGDGGAGEAEPMDVDEESEPEPAPKPKKVKKKAAIPAAAPAKGPGTPSKGRRPDRQLPAGVNFSVVDDYDVKLNQTNIGGGSNNNKFYIIQVLEGDGTYYSYNRWGRVGEVGQNKLVPHGGNLDGAIKDFKKKFRDKTKNSFDDIANFQKVPGKYQLVEIDDADEGGESADAALGKLSRSQIEKGQAVLAQVKTQLEHGASKSQLDELSSQFYSLIPTVTGRQKPEPINNEEILEAKENLLEFWLRMGFEDMEEVEGVTPIGGIMERPLPKTLSQAASNISDAYSIKSSVDKGTTLAKKKAGKPVRPMDGHLYGSILLYTGNSIYSALNAALRSENRKAVMKYFNYLRLLFEAMDCMPKKKSKLWRGISVDLHDQYVPGKTITWWSVSSCTSDENVARGFMNGCGGSCTLVILDTKTAMDISALSFYSNEKESLLAPGTQLLVKSRKRNGKITEVHMEEVGRCVE